MAESYIGPSPRNPYTGALSDALASAKKFGNQYEIKDWVPLLGGTGLGDLFLGGSPELIDDVSYQGARGLIKGGNEATGGIGTYTLDPRVADAAMVGLDAYGIGKLGSYGAKKAVGKAKETLTERLLREQVKESRREFLKSGAKGAAIAAAGAGGVAAARKFGKKAVEETAPKVADNAAVTAAKHQPKYIDSLEDYMKIVEDNVDAKMYDEAHIRAAEEVGPNSPDYDDIAEQYYDQLKQNHGKWVRRQLGDDETSYQAIRNNFKQNIVTKPDGSKVLANDWKQVKSVDGETGYIDDVSGWYTSTKQKYEFSPKAKKEMKDFKNFVRENSFGWNKDLYADPRVVKSHDIQMRMEGSGMDVTDLMEIYRTKSVDEALKKAGMLTRAEEDAIEAMYKDRFMKAKPNVFSFKDRLGDPARDFYQFKGLPDPWKNETIPF